MNTRGGAAAALILSLAIAGCGSSFGGGSSDKGSGTSNDALQHASDVSVNSCTADPTTGFVTAKVTVTNNSSKPSNYAITIAFQSKDGSTQLDTGLVAVNNLAPGQTSQQEANGLKTAPADGYDCKVADATRYAS